DPLAQSEPSHAPDSPEADALVKYGLAATWPTQDFWIEERKDLARHRMRSYFQARGISTAF
ncbi:MAG: hypothetical protein AAB425_08925, partial [Bdellovibrionota bacterium]